MTADVDSRRTAIQLDLVLVQSQLAEARRRQRQKDTPSNRSAVAAWLAMMDTVLDTYLAAGLP
jgi:hypothetical protein